MLARQEFIAFLAFPILMGMGLIVGVALTAVGRWRDGISIGLMFWVGAGLVSLAVASTWTAIGMAAAIIAIRHVVLPALNSSAPGRG